MSDKRLKECGTYSFCKGCDVKTNCCTAKTVDLPILVESDVNSIAKYSGLDPQTFCKKVSDNLYQMKPSEEGCFFYRGGKCIIYKNRPIDCRLFPFDLKLSSENELLLVQYTSVCNVPEGLVNESFQARELLKEIEPHMLEFAQHTTPLLQNHMYKYVLSIKISSENIAKIVTLETNGREFKSEVHHSLN